MHSLLFAKVVRQILSVSVVLIACGALAPLRATTLRIRADAWMPFNGDPKEEKPGYVIEVARLIFEPAGVTLDYALMPWTESLEAARKGDIDAVIGANPTEAEGLLLPAASAGMPRIGLFVRKDSAWVYENLHSLRSVKLGAIAGYSYWDAFDAYLKSEQGKKRVTFFEGETPLEDAIGHLKSGKIDVMAETLAVFVWTVRNQGGATGDYRMVFLQAGEPIYLAFAKNNTGAKCAKIFDEGMARLRKSGELAAILKKYGLSDWE
jgi:polar amino acid transport system substrate-binding protein